jgi:hypothetical protein
VFNLVYDRGLFPGFAIREFFKKILSEYIGNHEKKVNGIGLLPSTAGTMAGTYTFEELYAATGIDLVFTGTNVTQHRMYYFSLKDTPKFPVIEAVAISMNLPILFKPVYIEGKMPITPRNPTENGYQGYWVDGGLLNNLPLHAFDDAKDNPGRSDDPQLRPLHPKVLGLRLTDGFEDPKKNLAEAAKVAGTFDTLFEHFGGILGAMLAPAEEGQIRTPAERDQTIDLYTENLATPEFAPPSEKSGGPIQKARDKLHEYFRSQK